MLDSKEIVSMYVDQKKGIPEISEHFNTYTNKVRRILIKNGVKIRDRSECQKQSIKNGRHYHPTKGKKRDSAVKESISNSMADAWKNYSQEKVDELAEKAKLRWDARSEQEKHEFRKSAIEGVQKAAKNGSKIERAVVDFLEKNGYSVVFHKKAMIENHNLEIDIFIPSLKTAVEIDGPSHFKPIWGEDKLKKVMDQDNEKNGLLNKDGYNVVRVRHLGKHSQKYERDMCQTILEKLNYIKDNKCSGEFWEIEVNNAKRL